MIHPAFFAAAAYLIGEKEVIEMLPAKAYKTNNIIERGITLSL
jgi:hypothetical protein